MNDVELRERATASLDRQRKFSILFVAYVVGSLALIAIWGLTGDGYFWPGWPIAAVALVMIAIGLVRAWSGRAIGEVDIRERVARFSGTAPPGIQR